MVFNTLGRKVKASVQAPPDWVTNGILTNYVPIEGESLLDAAYRVCDDFLASCNVGKPVDFLYEENSISKALKQ
ncbi:MAG: hypothetical protein WKG07_31210 [Hymenobacter sp.]